MIKRMLDNCQCIEPHSIKNKHGIKYIIRINTIELNSEYVVKLQSYFSFIAKQYDSKLLKKYNNISVSVEIESNFFKDKSVVIFTESLLYSLLKERNIELYLNIKCLDRVRFEYNFYKYSYLTEVSLRRVKSTQYCEGFEKAIVKEHDLRYFIDCNQYDRSFASKIESDVSTVLKLILNKETINDICSIIGELTDNILTHTDGQGIIDLSFEFLKKSNEDGKYVQFTINVLNFSDNYLYTNLEKGYFSKTLDKVSMEILGKAYINQYKYFSDNDYSPERFFMVSSFQKGTTTRKKNRGGTGLNRTIRNLSKKSITNLRNDLSYVYSGKNVLKFDLEILNKQDLGDNIAFNEYNDYMVRPDKKCLTDSLFDFHGTAYNLMFIVKEEDL